MASNSFSRTHQDLVSTLQERGFIERDETAHALQATPRGPLLHDAARPLATTDAPAPMVDATRQVTPCPSPRTAATLIEALHLEPHHETLIVGSGIAWTGALAAALAPEATITLHEHEPPLQEHTRKLLHEGTLPDNATLQTSTRDLPRTLDRVLVADPHLDPTPFEDRLADEGVLVHPTASPEGMGLIRAYHDGTDTVKLHLDDTHIARQPDVLQQAPTEDGVSVAQLLATEALLETAWTEARPGETVQEIREATEETIGRAFAERGLRSSRPIEARVAQGAFYTAYVHQRTGELREASFAYTASADIIESAEAYTFRGWTRSHQGDLEGAIQDCKHAIQVDPALGNPYNDIGAYLLEKGNAREAVSWFEDATDADRYTSRHFPYLNLGRAHLRLGNRDEARQALERVLELDPGNVPATRLLERMQD